MNKIEFKAPADLRAHSLRKAFLTGEKEILPTEEWTAASVYMLTVLRGRYLTAQAKHAAGDEAWIIPQRG
jgi:hypothetical protein